MPWYKQSGAFQRRAAVNHQLRWPFARGDGELQLLKAGKSAILGPKPPESGECRLICFLNSRESMLMQDWLAQQSQAITVEWSKSIERHYPEAAPMWKDADLHVANMRAAFFPALTCLDFESALPEAGARVLDYGSGGGWLSALLSKQRQIDTTDALDTSEYNLNVLMPGVVSKLDGVLSKINPIRGMFEPILMEDGTYDLIVASSSIHHSSNLYGALRELRRVLKPTGTLILMNELPREDYHEYQLTIIYRILKSSLNKEPSEFSASISNSGILYDATLGDRSFGVYQYSDALSSAGFQFELLDSGHALKHVTRSLKHFVCKPTDAAIRELDTSIDPKVEFG